MALPRRAADTRATRRDICSEPDRRFDAGGLVRLEPVDTVPQELEEIVGTIDTVQEIPLPAQAGEIFNARGELDDRFPTYRMVRIERSKSIGILG